MNALSNSILRLLAAVVVLCSMQIAATAGEPLVKGPMKETSKAPKEIDQATRVADDEWQEKLTPEQYYILRKAGTEAPNGAVYQQFKKQGAGTYYCAGCGSKLFSSEHKFDSRCGWPSFWDPAEIDSIETRRDHSLGVMRVEVVCANCKGHLGHVFEGEGFDTPTDQRYCINGQVLVYVPDEAGETEEK